MSCRIEVGALRTSAVRQRAGSHPRTWCKDQASHWQQQEHWHSLGTRLAGAYEVEPDFASLCSYTMRRAPGSGQASAYGTWGAFMLPTTTRGHERREWVIVPVMIPYLPNTIVAALALAAVAAGGDGLGYAKPAAAQSAPLTKEQSEAQAAYDRAVREFKAVLSERRAQIDAKRPLPERPGQAVYLARVEVMSTYKDLTDANPLRIGRPNKFGVPPAYFDVAIEPLIDEYTALFKHMQTPPSYAQASETPLQGRRRSRPRDRARQGARCGDRRRCRPHQPRHLLRRDQRQPEHRQCPLHHLQGQPADGRLGRSQGARAVGGAEGESGGG